MAYNIFSNIVGNAKQGLAKSVKAVATGPIQAATNALKQFVSKLSDRQGSLDSLICALTCNADMIHEDFIDAQQIAINAEELISNMRPVEIDEETAELIMAGIADAESGLIDEGRLTMSDASGRVYNLINEQKEIESGHFISLISTNTDALDRTDSLVYREVETGKVFFNNVIKTANYKWQHIIYNADTVAEACRVLCSIKGYDSTGTILGDLRLLVPSYDEQDTIRDLVSSLCADYEVTSSGELLTDLNSILTINNINEGAGTISSVWMVVQSLIESSAINDALIQVGTAVGSVNDVASNLSSAISTLLTSKFASVRDFASSISNAYSSGGLLAAINVVLGYFKSTQSIIADDGILQFSNNKSLVPQQYIAGLVMQVAETAVGIATLVVSIFSRVAGAVLAVAGPLLLTPFKAIAYDYEVNTRAQYDDDAGTQTPSSPYALFQMEIPLNIIPQGIIRSIATTGNSYIVSIPGGSLLLGPGGFNSDSILTKIRAEFHPDIITRTDAVKVIADKLIAKHCFSAIVTDSQGTASANCSFTKPNNYSLLDMLNDWSAGTPDAISYANEVRQNNNVYVVNEDNDNYMRDAILVNSAIMHLWLLLASSTVGLTKTCDVLVSAEDPGTVTQYVTEPWRLLWNGLPVFMLSGFGSQPWESQVYIGAQLLMNYAILFGHNAYSSWTELSNAVVHCNEEYGDGAFATYLNLSHDLFIDYPFQICQGFKWTVSIPKYDASTFIKWVTISAFVTAVTTALVITAALVTRKVINKKRAQNQARVEKTWGDFAKYGTDEDYANYRKAVKTNNRWANLIGGTKYSYVNYWDTSSSSGQGEYTLPDPFAEEDSTSVLVNDMSTEQTRVNVNDSLDSISDIKTLITGQ